MHISGLWVHLHPQRDIKLHPWFDLDISQESVLDDQKAGFIDL